MSDINGPELAFIAIAENWVKLAVVLAAIGVVIYFVVR